MKSFITAALLLIGVNASAQTSKVLLYCDYYTPNQTGDIYVDVYLDYDAATETYTNIESGIVESANAKYPDHLWALKLDYTAGNPTATVTIERDLDMLTFDFPTVSTASTPTFAIPKTSAGAVEDFTVHMKGFYTGLTIDQDFLCYDPATKENKAQR